MNNVLRTILAASAFSACTAFAQSVAFITNLKGDVHVDANPRPLILSELAKGQKLALGADAQVSVMYTSTGKEYMLKGPAQYEVRDTEVVSASGMPPVARSTEWRASPRVLTQVAQTSSASVRMRSLAAPKVEAAPKLVYPTAGSVATLQPMFRWTGDDKARSELTVLMTGQEKPVHHAKTTGASYRIPTKLKPDTEYAWVLTSGGQEVGTGKFRTLSADAIGAVEKRRPADKSEFSDRVLFALMLQEMGAAQEARELWTRLAQERSDLPELSALAK
jgi:hypothetical protein